MAMRSLAARGFGREKGLAAEEIINLIGVTLAIFSFIFGPWLGSRSGLWVLGDLARFLTNPGQGVDVSRQKGIFVVLTLLALIFIGLAIAVYTDIRTKERRWSIVGILLAVAALILLGVLFFGYDARTAGVLSTALGCMIAGGSALAMNYRGLREGYPELSKALPELEQMWAGVLLDAKATKTPFSILALSTSDVMHSEVVDLVDEQLRARDIEFPTQESLFVLLWETDAVGAMTAARHAQDILAEEGHGYSWVGVVSFPEDGDEMGDLLERAEHARGLAREFGDQSAVVPFSYPARSEAPGLIERAWEATLAEAKTSNTPLALLAMTTSQSPKPADVALVKEELRSRDLVFPVQDGLFVLLWKVNLENALGVANHLQEILASQKHIQSHVGIARFPEDGDQIGVLLERAEAELGAARSA